MAVSAALSGLAENTTYHFRVLAKNAGGTTEGADETFTTTSTPVKPTVKTEPASSVASTSATVNAVVNPNGFEVTECKFEYGPALPYTKPAPCTPAPGSGTANVAVSAALSSGECPPFAAYPGLASDSQHDQPERSIAKGQSRSGADRTHAEARTLAHCGLAGRL